MKRIYTDSFWDDFLIKENRVKMQKNPLGFEPVAKTPQF